MVAATSMGTHISLTMVSKKIPIIRNQLQIQFAAKNGGGAYQGAFAAYASQAVLVSKQAPPSFWFSKEPFESSFIFSFPCDGLYQVIGDLYDYELLNS